MIFTLFGEISLVTIGLLYVFNMWFDSCINYAEMVDKNNEDKQLSEAAKHMYS